MSSCSVQSTPCEKLHPTNKKIENLLRCFGGGVVPGNEVSAIGGVELVGTPAFVEHLLRVCRSWGAGMAIVWDREDDLGLG